MSIKVLHGIGHFALFCSSDLDLDPMIFIYELDYYLLKMHQRTENELSTSRLSIVMVLHTDRQTYIILPPKLLQRHLAVVKFFAPP